MYFNKRVEEMGLLTLPSHYEVSCTLSLPCHEFPCSILHGFFLTWIFACHIFFHDIDFFFHDMDSFITWIHSWQGYSMTYILSFFFCLYKVYIVCDMDICMTYVHGYFHVMDSSMM